VTEERASFEADVQSRNIEVADLKMQLALLQDQFDKAKSSDAADAEALRSGLDQRGAEIATLTAAVNAAAAERDKAAAERDQAAAELASARAGSDEAMKSLANKDAALNESYQRVVNLQRVLEDRDAALAAAQAELTAARTDLASLNSMKAELEDRLQKVRGDVAGEMAVLTSTMIKLKEEQLVTANARIAELMQELNAQKASQAVG
jgi:chromosome segregation ATPase